MATVIDAMSVVRNERRLPTEAFFVDNNIVIAYADPFSQSNDSKIKRWNSKVIEAVEYLKANNHRACSTVGVAIEFFNHIRYGFYMSYFIERPSSLDTAHFKELRGTDEDFARGWNLHLQQFERLFKKRFQIYSVANTEDILLSFRNIPVDFADHVLYDAVMSLNTNSHCIFTNDRDFYNYPDDLYLLTTNGTIIQQAREDKKLLDSNSMMSIHPS